MMASVTDLAESSGEISIGSFETQGYIGVVAQAVDETRGLHERDLEGHMLRNRAGHGAQMADAAVVIDDRARFVLQALRTVVGLALRSMLMLVVSEVLHRYAAFMAAVGRCCRPGELEGQHQEHQDEDTTAHGKQCSDSI